MKQLEINFSVLKPEAPETFAFNATTGIEYRVFHWWGTTTSPESGKGKMVIGEALLLPEGCKPPELRCQLPIKEEKDDYCKN